MKKFLIVCVAVILAMLYPATAFASYNSAAEESWLEDQLGKDVYFIDKVEIEIEDQHSWTGTPPEGSVYYVVKGSTSLVFGTITGAGEITITSEGLETKKGQEPAISHISFFGVKTVVPPDDPDDPDNPDDPKGDPGDPEGPPKDDVPQTGDTLDTLLLSVLAAGALGYLFYETWRVRKN